MRELEEHEMREWIGLINHTTHHGVPKPGSATTLLRIMSNSSFNAMKTRDKEAHMRMFVWCWFGWSGLFGLVAFVGLVGIVEIGRR